VGQRVLRWGLCHIPAMQPSSCDSPAAGIPPRPHPHLHNTGEAADAALGLEPGPVPGMVSTTKEMLVRFVRTHLPLKAHSKEGKDDKGQGRGGRGGCEGTSQGGRG